MGRQIEVVSTGSLPSRNRHLMEKCKNKLKRHNKKIGLKRFYSLQVRISIMLHSKVLEIEIVDTQTDRILLLGFNSSNVVDSSRMGRQIEVVSTGSLPSRNRHLMEKCKNKLKRHNKKIGLKRFYSLQVWISIMLHSKVLLTGFSGIPLGILVLMEPIKSRKNSWASCWIPWAYILSNLLSSFTYFL